MVFNNFGCLDLVDLLLRTGVFICIEYLYDVFVVSVASLVVAFCAFYCSFNMCEIWYVVWVYAR